MNPVVSVVIPAYNAENYIKECIDSVLQQSFNDYEIIVVDDGSSDQTRKILEEYMGSIRYIYQQNGGPGKARNTGITAARGKYIAFLDSDDLWTSEKLQTQVDFLESHPAIDVVIADMMQFTHDGVVFNSHTRDIVRKDLSRELFLEHHEIQEPLLKLLQWNFISTGTVVLRKNCLQKTGLFDENPAAPPCEDIDLWMRIAIFSKMGFVPKVLVKKREHQSNISREFYRAITAAIYVLEKFQRDFPQYTKKYKKHFDLKLSKRYFELGYHYFSNHELTKARSYFKISYNRKNNVKSACYLMCCFLPKYFINLARRYKKIALYYFKK